MLGFQYVQGRKCKKLLFCQCMSLTSFTPEIQHPSSGHLLDVSQRSPTKNHLNGDTVEKLLLVKYRLAAIGLEILEKSIQTQSNNGNSIQLNSIQVKGARAENAKNLSAPRGVNEFNIAYSYLTGTRTSSP
uniref:Uncharacterized protein n=1 Tax=Romanomermis culicivorax TaxID=13658 RepID=A0A915IHR4_ROMCU